MKNLLIIQLDSSYFLNELYSALSENIKFLKEQFNISIYCHKESYQKITENTGFKVIHNAQEFIHQQFHISINLSLNETAWFIHEQVNSDNKIGPYSHKENSLNVNDSWSSYLMTLKCPQPFLTFSLANIFKNIIGLKGLQTPKSNPSKIKNIFFDTIPTHLLSGEKQESLISEIHQNFPHIKLLTIDEWKNSEHSPSESLVIGIPSVESYHMLNAGIRGILFSSVFSGFNLIPGKTDNYLLVGKNEKFDLDQIFEIIKSQIKNTPVKSINYSFGLYKTNDMSYSTTYFERISGYDHDYYLYEANFVLWNFLLNLEEIEIKNSLPQNKNPYIAEIKPTLAVLIKLQSYALSSLQQIYVESKKTHSDTKLILEHQHKLLEIDIHLDKIAQSHLYLRQILDYYRIKKTQDFGEILTQKTQHLFLVYQEEQEALKAFLELITVTEKYSEATI